jgi:hypothetical protein
MLRRKHPVLRKLLWATGLGMLCCLTGVLIWFPGRQSLLALTLATGIGVGGLQRQVDQVEEKAIHGRELSAAEKRFLVDLYSCFAKGGAVVAPQSSKMMHRYLSRTGESLAVSPALFQHSAPVRNAMNELRKKVLQDLKGGRNTRERYSSDTFYMGDPAYFDAFVGL